MLSGQLYYYQKKVGQLKDNLTPENVDKIELAGVEIEPNAFVGMEKGEIARILKDKFSSVYGTILKDDGLLFAFSFWAALTSPLRKTEIEKEPETDYQEFLISWLEKETPFEDINSLLSSGVLSTNEEDYACFYGLSVLNELTLSQIENDEFVNFENELKASSVGDSELSIEPQILVVCSSYLAPLFVNLNSEFLPYSKDFEVNLANIQNKLNENREISLVLLVGRDNPEHLHLLQKKLPDKILVSNLNLEDSGENSEVGTYFDRLVKETLGIKLT